VAVYSQATPPSLSPATTSQPASKIGYDGWVSVHAPLPRATASNYSGEDLAGDSPGIKIQRSIYLYVKPKQLKKPAPAKKKR
jgi:hypothetical protein